MIKFYQHPLATLYSPQEAFDADFPAYAPTITAEAISQCRGAIRDILELTDAIVVKAARINNGEVIDAGGLLDAEVLRDVLGAYRMAACGLPKEFRISSREVDLVSKLVQLANNPIHLFFVEGCATDAWECAKQIADEFRCALAKYKATGSNTDQSAV